ncbi:MAG: hypothetical protein CMM07_20295 [Rhodopirellula sp.]|nr:hypothetical protein [Rhodopirellula sp.]
MPSSSIKPPSAPPPGKPPPGPPEPPLTLRSPPRPPPRPPPPPGAPKPPPPPRPDDVAPSWIGWASPVISPRIAKETPHRMFQMGRRNKALYFTVCRATKAARSSTVM